MSAAASTEPAALSPVVLAAARGELPEWAVATPRRREHIARVAELLREWSAALGLSEAERIRWTAAGWLHDALRDASESLLRPIVGDAFADFPPPLLHGPAAAARLAGEADEAILTAVRYHTTGHPALDRMGRALYLADFLEPGRDFSVEWRASLRARMRSSGICS